jgi:retron-type reverse transcriptase
VIIKGFFNNIDHKWLTKMLEERINDKQFVRLIQKWLKAGILEEDGEIKHPVNGTPQGGLCQALHNPPYAKKVIMPSNLLILLLFQ